jgi:zinc/manganese transport system permease protein
MEVFELLLWPFLGCVALVLIHAYFGAHILERGIIFVDIALAQFIGAGIALSFFITGENNYLYSMAFAVLGAFILSISKLISRVVNIEAFIGVLYIFSFAAAILVLDRTPHGLEEFKSILNGNILWLTPCDVYTAFALYAAIGLFHYMLRRRFSALSYEGQYSFVWEFAFFLSFALVLVKSVQMAGILQVFAFLIVPALIGRLCAKKRSVALVTGWLAGLTASVLGIGLSYKLDLPTAPLVVASLSLFFFGLLILKSIKSRISGAA